MHAQQKNESLSALVDDELKPHQARRILRALHSGGGDCDNGHGDGQDTSPVASTSDADAHEHARTWKRYHLIGSLLRGEHRCLPGGAHETLHIAERITVGVAKVIANDMASDAASDMATTSSLAKVRLQLSWLRQAGDRMKIIRTRIVAHRHSAYILPLASVASVAMLAVFTLSIINNNDAGIMDDVLQTQSDSPIQTAHVSRNATPVTAKATRWHGPSQHAHRPQMEKTMNAFLVEHGEFSSAHGINGLSSYVRFIGYDEIHEH